MGLSEFANNAFLIPISLDVRESQRRLREKNPNRPPLPYIEFSVYEVIIRATLGVQTGDIVQTLDLSSCVITEIKSDGTLIVHSIYWDDMHQVWRAYGKKIKLKDVTAFLGHTFDEQKAKQHIITEPTDG